MAEMTWQLCYFRDNVGAMSRGVLTFTPDDADGLQVLGEGHAPREGRERAEQKDQGQGQGQGGQEGPRGPQQQPHYSTVILQLSQTSA